MRVMLAEKIPDLTTAKLSFPMLASPKIDGVRAIHSQGMLLSRSAKPIPNRHVQATFASTLFDGLDGELVCGLPTDKNLMQQTTSGVMTHAGEPMVTWYIFDHYNPDNGYITRASNAAALIRELNHPQVVWLPQSKVTCVEDIVKLEEDWLNQGYEGLMLRGLYNKYKHGRSTLKEQGLLKVKRFADAEAEVIGVIELQRNANEAFLDERGYTKRTSHKENQIQAGILGALQVKDLVTGMEFEIGTGFTLEQRTNLWAGRQYLRGKLVKYKHFPIGVVDKPRHPVFVGFRDRRDM